MKTINIYNSVYEVRALNKFNKQVKKVIKHGKDIEKIIYVVEKLANLEKLDPKYKDHQL